jgi:hypothetical protein
MRLVLSPCNPPGSSDRILMRLDSAQHTAEWVRLANRAISAVAGLAVHGDSLYALCVIDGLAYAAIFAYPALALRELIPLRGVSDPHSIIVNGDGSIVVVSTGSDEIVAFDLARRDAPGEIVWRASNTGGDAHHINSIVMFAGTLICSGFGPLTNGSWRSTIDGFVFDVTRGRLLKTGIHHPHSLTVVGADLYLCESATGVVRNLTANRTIATLSGYLRGLAVDARGHLWVGSSIGRQANLAEGAPAHGVTECAVYCIDASTGAALSGMGLGLAAGAGAFPEIYDIVVLGE